MAEEKKLWRRSFGRKGVSRVNVYERYPGSALYIEWWLDGKRHQKSLKTVAGHPVTDRHLAEKIAKEVSAEQERLHNRRAQGAVFGMGTIKTLADLFEMLHKARGPEWSMSYRRAQERASMSRTMTTRGNSMSRRGCTSWSPRGRSRSED